MQLMLHLLPVVLTTFYNHVIDALCESANTYVPKHKKNYYKFWWGQELDLLKEQAMASCRAWKSDGKPRRGPIHLQYRQNKLLYKKALEISSSVKLYPILMIYIMLYYANQVKIFGNVGIRNLKINQLILYRWMVSLTVA